MDEGSETRFLRDKLKERSELLYELVLGVKHLYEGFYAGSGRTITVRLEKFKEEYERERKQSGIPNGDAR